MSHVHLSRVEGQIFLLGLEDEAVSLGQSSFVSKSRPLSVCVCVLEGRMSYSSVTVILYKVIISHIPF